MKSLLLSLPLVALAVFPARAEHCPATMKIEGTYQCSGECVVTTNGTRSLIQVPTETDVITAFPGSRQGLYQVTITGGGDFRETEIGPLHRCVLSTATSQVSDGHYPVLEEYYFNPKRRTVTGFTKIVRNPEPNNFKTCKIECTKISKP